MLRVWVGVWGCHLSRAVYLSGGLLLACNGCGCPATSRLRVVLWAPMLSRKLVGCLLAEIAHCSKCRGRHIWLVRRGILRSWQAHICARLLQGPRSL